MELLTVHRPGGITTPLGVLRITPEPLPMYIDMKTWKTSPHTNSASFDANKNPNENENILHISSKI